MPEMMDKKNNAIENAISMTRSSASSSKNKARRAAPSAPAVPKLQDPKKGADPHAAQAVAVLGQFRLIFKSVRKHFRSVEESAGVSGAQLWVLSEVAKKPGLRVTELARAMSIHQSTASNLIERLEREGHIERRRDPADQRVVRLFLTPAARRAVAKAPGPPEGVLPDALKRLSTEDLVALGKHLFKLTSLLRVRDASGKKTPLSEI